MVERPPSAKWGLVGSFTQITSLFPIRVSYLWRRSTNQRSCRSSEGEWRKARECKGEKKKVKTEYGTNFRNSTILPSPSRVGAIFGVCNSWGWLGCHSAMTSWQIRGTIVWGGGGLQKKEENIKNESVNSWCGKVCYAFGPWLLFLQKWEILILTNL